MNLQAILFDELRLLLLPLAVAAEGGAPGQLLSEVTGWSLSIDDPAANSTLAAFKNAYQGLDDLFENPPETLADVLHVLDKVNELFAALRQVPAKPGAETGNPEDLAKDLIQALVIDYLKNWHPAVHDVLALLTVIQPPADISLNRIPDLLSDPLQVLRAEYLKPQGLSTAKDAKAVADKLFPRIAALLSDLGFDAAYGSTPENGLDLGELGTHISAGMLTVFLQPDFETANRYGVILGLSSKDLGDFGLVVKPFGEVLPYWDVDIDLTGASAGFAIGPQGLTMFGASNGVNSSPGVFNCPGFVIGSTTGTRLEIGQFQISGNVSLNTNTQEYGVLVDMGSSALVISAGEGDGFLQAILPADGVRANFDLAIGWSNQKGFYFRGSAELDATLALGISIGGVLTIPAIHLALQADNAALTAEVSLSAGLSIGPVQALVDRIGLISVITFPDGAGNLGIADMTFGFKPPSGAGISINSAGVSGGGFLRHDDPTHEYSGVLQLEFNDLSLQAFGLITTQVTGGHGYSLLAMIDADFPPVQLGWGFTLNGVGGLLAVHRTASVDALHAALKADKLSTVLFPKNAITNASQILAQLDALFPVASGRFLFGPMALVGWGTPTVLTVALAVIIELPEPIRIILLARLAARLPSESQPLVRINMDALGVLDLSQDSLSLDATLYDSRLIDYPISGDMALRANWGSAQREFLLAIGGFHPQFTPPAGFPVLKRVTIDMPSGPVSKLRLAAYLAISSNTLQFGSALDVFIGVSGFGLSGHLGFDALLQLDPFHFDADISGRVALTAGGDDLMSVGLDATLSGPAPWHIAGDFKFHIVFFDVHKSFSQTWGNDAPAQQIAPVEVLPLLAVALADPRNWGAALPSGTSAFVSLNNSGGSIVHPLARLEVHESVVPFGLSITRFGSAPATGATSFTISDYRVNGSSAPYETIQDDFAPAQFFDLSDDEKLARPSFEPHDAGVRLKSGLVSCGAPVAKTIAYETFYVDKPGGALRTDKVTPPKTFVLGDLSLILTTGASGRAEIRMAGKRSYTAPGNPVRIAPQSFVIADRNSLNLAGIGAPQGATFSEAQALLNAVLAQNPASRTGLQIISTHEIST